MNTHSGARRTVTPPPPGFSSRRRGGRLSAGLMLGLLGCLCAGTVPPSGYLDDYSNMQRSMLGDYWYRLAPGHRLHEYRHLWIAEFGVFSTVTSQDSTAIRQLAHGLRFELTGRLEQEGIFESVVLDDDENVDLYLQGVITDYRSGSRTVQFFGAGAPKAQIEARVLDGATHAEVARIVAVPSEVIPGPGTITIGEVDRYNLTYRAALAFFDFFRIERARSRNAAP